MLLFQYLQPCDCCSRCQALEAHEQVQLQHGGLHGQVKPRAEEYGYSRALSSQAVLSHMLRGVMSLHPKGAAIVFVLYFMKRKSKLHD